MPPKSKTKPERPGPDATDEEQARYERDSLDAAMESFGDKFKSDDEETPAFHRKAFPSDEPTTPEAPQELPPAEKPKEEPKAEESEKAPEPEPDPEPDPPKEEPKAEEPKAEEKKPAEEPAKPTDLNTVVRYRVNHEDREMDLRTYLTDPAKYPELVKLIQKGEDYDRQRALADEARSAATERETRLTRFTEFAEQKGWIRKNPVTGMYEEAPQRTASEAQQAQRYADAANQGVRVIEQDRAAMHSDPAERRLTELTEKMGKEGLSAGEIREMVSLESQRSVNALKAELAQTNQVTRQQQQQAEEQRKIAEVIEQAKKAVGTRHAALRSLYTDPTTGQVDEYRFTQARHSAWARIMQGGSLNDALTAMDVDARAYHSHAQNVLAQVRAAREKRAAAPVAPGTPAGRSGPVAAQPQRGGGIDLDAPAGKDGLAEAFARWQQAAAQGG